MGCAVVGGLSRPGDRGGRNNHDFGRIVARSLHDLSVHTFTTGPEFIAADQSYLSGHISPIDLIF
jgi:hypothetical protein